MCEKLFNGAVEYERRERKGDLLPVQDIPFSPIHRKHTTISRARRGCHLATTCKSLMHVLLRFSAAERPRIIISHHFEIAVFTENGGFSSSNAFEVSISRGAEIHGVQKRTEFEATTSR